MIYGADPQNEPDICIVDGEVTVDRTEGMKFDEGKFPWELLSFPALEQVVRVLEHGKKKYTARNWEKGLMYGRLFGAVLRHLTAWWLGAKFDKESGLHPLAHAMCDIMFLLHYEYGPYQRFDNRPNHIQGERS